MLAAAGAEAVLHGAAARTCGAARGAAHGGRPCARPTAAGLRGLDLYGCDDEKFRAGLIAITKDGSKRGWWLSYRDVITASATDLIALETDASTFKTYEPSFIPGLFQTAEYARIVIDRLRTVPGGTVDNAAATGFAFRKSSYSGGNENCVECAAARPGEVAVRDSKDPEGPALTFTAAAHTAFITAVTEGEFDFGLF
ncbi:Scr1 family TA system antitoxin-like transcriptional regulator [Kitasatospora sp. NPDC004240]